MTFAAIAAELGLDERTARRIVGAVLAKLRAGLGDAAEPEIVARVLVLVLAERDLINSSTAQPTISRVPRRFSDNRGEGVEHAPCGPSATLPRITGPGSSSVGSRAEHLPRRFRSKP